MGLSCIFGTFFDVQGNFKSEVENGKISDINVDDFKELICGFQKLSKYPKHIIFDYREHGLKMNDVILSMLTTLELQMECQIVGSKALCAGYLVYNEVSEAFNKFSAILDSGSQNKFCNSDDYCELTSAIPENVKKSDTFKVCLSLAIVEMNIDTWRYSHINFNKFFLHVIYPICEENVYKYTPVTLLAFRSLVKLFEILSLINDVNFVLESDIIYRTMTIVMSNWDNPLTGVREQNVLLFKKIFSLTNKMQWIDCVSDNSDDSEVFKENPLLCLVLTQQTWMMRSKYFLLSTIIENCDTYKLLELYRNEIFTGLKISLKYMYLVPAGSELFKMCVRNVSSWKWEDIFLPFIMEILSDSDSLMKQNVVNYWVPFMVKQNREFFDSLFNAVKTLPADIDLYSFISLYKLGCSSGAIINFLYGINDNDLEKLRLCLVHSDDIIRSDAFAVICYEKAKNDMPFVDKITLVQQFLTDNINYDCSRLRQSLINSFAMLSINIRDFFSFERRDSRISVPERVEIIIHFLKWLFDFLISNLEDGCNFQRKYTSLLIYEVVLNCIVNGCDNLKNSKPYVNVNVKQLMEQFYEQNFLSHQSRRILFSCILDPSENVRSTAVNILSKNFNIKPDDVQEVSELYEKGKALCSDRLFYRAESGSLFVKIVAILICKNEIVDENLFLKLCNGRQSVLDELLDIAEDQKGELITDILKAASNGSPLHGILMAIIELCAESDNDKLKFFSPDKIERLLCLMENVVEYLLNALTLKTSDVADFAPSFAEMGKSIACLAQKSNALLDEEVNEDVHLSSSHQLILNCIWLNIKTCCTLAEKLVTSDKLMSNEKWIQRCVELISLVLRRCRHKGAIESVGVAIMHVTKYLTSHKDLKLRGMPAGILDQVFENLISSDNGTVSRRSAGLTILVHRILAGDSTKKKTLLKNCVEKLIETASREVNSFYNELVDLPQSRALHFLCSLVQDSSLRQDMTRHISSITILCFSTMSSSVWTIRNAALQLFGALVPKLIGQKKHQENEDGSEYYMFAFEELFFHGGNLFCIIDKQFKSVVNSNDIMMHSKLVPSLTLLSNLTVTMHSSMSTNLRSMINCFNSYLETLFSSPIYHIRKLSAKINSNFCLPLKLDDLLKLRVDQVITEFQRERIDQNKLHGLLLNVTFLLSKFYKLKESMFYLNNEKFNCLDSLTRLLTYKDTSNIPYFTKTVYLQIISYIGDSDLIEILKSYVNSEIIEKKHFFNSGHSLLCNRVLKLLILKCKSEEIGNYADMFLAVETCYVNVYFFEALKLRLDCLESVDICYNDLLNKLVDFTVQRDEIEVLVTALDVILMIVLKLKNNLNIEQKLFGLYNKFFKDGNRYGIKCCRLVLLIICSCMSEELFSSCGTEIVNTIYKWSSADDEFNEDLRMSSAICSMQIAPYLKATKPGNEICMSIWKSVCNLLQDENVCVRKQVTKFAGKIFDDSFYGAGKLKTFNPSIVLSAMYKVNYMERFMDRDFAIQYLWNVLDKNTSNELTVDSLNPFDHGLNNVYKEDVKIFDLVCDALISVLKSDNQQSLLNLIDESMDNQINNGLLDNKFNNSNNWNLNKKRIECRNKLLSLFPYCGVSVE